MEQTERSTIERSLFREEAAAGVRESWLGGVLLHQHWSHSVIAVIAMSFVASVAVFSYYGTYTRKATVTGLLMPEQGLLRLTANEKGVVDEVRVKEGQRVEAGDVLFVVSDERLSNAGSFQRRVAEQLDQRVQLLSRNRILASERADSQLRMLDSRSKSINEEIERFDEELQFLEKRIRLAEAHLNRQKDLVAARFITVSQFQEAEVDLLSLQGQRQALKRSIKSTQRARTEVQSERTVVELGRQGELSDIDNGIAIVRQEQAENDARAGQINSAPFAGRITGVNIQSGQQLIPGMLLASLIPNDVELVAHVYLASRQIGFIEPGQAAQLRYAAYPYQKFGMAKGRVLDVAKVPYALQELPAHIAGVLQGVAAISELYYRVTISLDYQSFKVYGVLQPLRAGMLVEADIIQDKRRLYEWVLEPIYSISGRFIY